MTIDDGNGAVNKVLDGNENVFPLATTTYILTAVDDTGCSDSCQVTVTVLPTCDSFTATPGSIDSGKSTLLE